MRPRSNRRIERAAVNAIRTFMEDNDCVFQEIDGANDYGKDAYVDLGDEARVTGVCAALQIKGGRSFRDSRGDYRLPVDDNHRRVWAESTVPILAIIHDPEDGGLRWKNISADLHKHPTAKSIVIPRQSLLTAISLRTEFLDSILAAAGNHPAGILAQVLDRDEATSTSAVFDAFAVGRSDPRVLIGLRYLLRALPDQTRRAAIHILSHATPHPDIFWHKGNWIPESAKNELRLHFRWSTDDVTAILSAAPLATFERGEIGESAYMLLREDPRAEEIVAATAGLAVREGQLDVAASALYLTLYWLRDQAPRALQAFRKEYPEADTLPMLSEIQYALREHGYLSLF